MAEKHRIFELLALGGALAAFAMPALAQDLPRHPERSGLGLEFSEPTESLQVPGGRVIENFDKRRSIFVTDVAIMQRITFASVMEKLVEGTGTTKEALFAQWWDTQAAGPGSTGGPHCDDQPADGSAAFGGFPYRCPRSEASEAANTEAFDPVAPGGYSAIAYSNRFDLVDKLNGSNCGEYRVVFARNSGKTEPVGRNLIIFEALVPNPDSSQGWDGCRQIQEFWLGLSDPALTDDERGDQLRRFYLEGLPKHNVVPVIDRAHFALDTGQIRTNQFLNEPDFRWTLREFKIAKSGGALTMVPTNVKSNPGNALFLANSTHPQAGELIDQIIDQLDVIRGGAGGESDISTFAFNTPESLNSFESDESEATEGDVLTAFNEQPDGPLRAAIEAALTAGGSSLTADNVIRRIRVMTCAGCHEYSSGDANLGGGLVWPPSLGFTHVSEADSALESGPGGPRYAISEALEIELLPARQKFIREYLDRFP